MNLALKRFLPHLSALALFIILALAYFNPVLQGKVIQQSDIVQYIGMAKQQKDHIKSFDEEPYWTDSAFGGMPTYQLGANYPYNYVKQVDRLIRFLPRPADYLFLYFIGLYILLLALKIDYKLAILGALAFGFSTYMIIILGVGHNAKAHAIAYMPWVLAGIILVFREKYFWGSLLLFAGMALEINANHFQMTYYLLVLTLVLGVAYLIDFYKKNKLKVFFSRVGIMIVPVLLAIGANATNLLATKEYTDFSTRGPSVLTLNPDGSEKENSGLDYGYITEYSYGILESFNLFIPRFMGGASAEKLSTDSATYNSLLQMGASPAQAKEFVKRAPTYWGDQTYIGAPAYIGASVLFLFVFALYLVKGRLKWWLLGGSILALLLSWGDNLALLTKFFVNYISLYNKFRAVSSIQVILELCIPVLGIMGLSVLFKQKYHRTEMLEALKKSTFITGGIALVFLLLKGLFFDFSGAQDRIFIEQFGPDFVRSLKEDRKSIFTEDSLRSLILVLAVAGTIWLFLKQKLQKNTSILILGVIIVFDLVAVDRRYVNNDAFVAKRFMEQPFQPTAANQQVLQDETHYRVLDLSNSPFNSSAASYFHHSIGGYHAAKPQRMQDLFEYHISKGNQEVLNMLNTKYILMNNQGEDLAQLNADANGNAWFINEVVVAQDADVVISMLDTLNTKNTAVVHKEFAAQLKQKSFQPSVQDTIYLKSYKANELIYGYKTNKDQLAVFSEIYYPYGWNAYLDGELIPHFRVNYTLRAAELPAGEHELVFKFEPQVIQKGSTYTLISGVLVLLLLLGGIYFKWMKKKGTSID
jgi:hypothetical protein